jgi:hypothetical protein
VPLESHADDDDEVAFWRCFIVWWAREKLEPIPPRAWEALEVAQRRAELTEGTGSAKCHP